MKIQLGHTFEEIISLENLLSAWQEFIVGKKSKPDVQLFARELMDNIISLHTDLANFTYRHGGYESFFVNDPKRRHIHKASVRDRLLHHAVYRILYPFFERTFIGDSYSCRNDKGTHKAINRFRALAYQVSRNHTRTCWVLKCDIKKFFASIDHKILLDILGEYIPDKDVMRLLGEVVESFETITSPPLLSKEGLGVVCRPLCRRGRLVRRRDNASAPLGTANPSYSPLGKGREANPFVFPLRKGERRTGLPLGNLTSQLFANVYLNVFDQWVKHHLPKPHPYPPLLGEGQREGYIRYADDFVTLSTDKHYLENILPRIKDFFINNLKLALHPDKIFIQTIASGVDFLGWVNFPDHRVLRTTTKKRMLRRIRENPENETTQSYLGMLGHGNTYNLRQESVNLH